MEIINQIHANITMNHSVYSTISPNDIFVAPSGYAGPRTAHATRANPHDISVERRVPRVILL
nr:hypothetical protein GCM10020063_112210 [Dactylosporangium thailandense]